MTSNSKLSVPFARESDEVEAVMNRVIDTAENGELSPFQQGTYQMCLWLLGIQNEPPV